MNKIKILLMMQYLIKRILLEFGNVCNEGCLKCLDMGKATERCLVCDSFMKYTLNGKSCQKDELKNCLISFEINKCHQCEYGYYLTGDNRCVEMKRLSKLRIPSCNSYERADKCVACNLNSFIKNGLCRPTGKNVDFCTKFLNNEECEFCDLKLPSFNNTYCESVNQSKFSNCMFFRHPLSCKTCKPGFELDENYFLQELGQKTDYKDFFTLFKFWKQEYFNIVFNTPTCKFSYNIDHCLVLDHNKLCKECENEYTLSTDKKRCFIRPSPPINPTYRIPNCYKFESKNYEKCLICYENFYLYNQKTQCKKHTAKVPNCQIHSQITNQKCIYCDNQYYLVENETNPEQMCKNRDKFFNNCAEYERITDVCKRCAEDHIFHDNNTRCSKIIPNCKTHDISGRILKCSDCIDSHYQNDFKTECIDANKALEGCQKYKSVSECQICLQGYYKDSLTKTCLNHDLFIGCQYFNVDTKNVCDKCLIDGVKTKYVTDCTKLDDTIAYSVPGCSYFNSNQVCEGCEIGKVIFQEAGNNKCITFYGCLSLLTITNNAECGVCATGFKLFGGQCGQIIDTGCIMSFKNNKTVDVATYKFTDEYPCNLCAKNQYYNVATPDVPFYLCVTLAEPPISNCLTYSLDNTNSYQCDVCKRGYYKSGSGCVAVDATKTLYFNNLGVYSNTDLTAIDWEVTATKTQINTYCEYVSQLKNSCLKCKTTTIFYKFTNFIDIFDSTNHLDFYRYRYLDPVLQASNKPRNEQIFYWKEPKSKGCLNEASNSKATFQWKYEYGNQEIMYLCKDGIAAFPDPTQALNHPLMDRSKLTILAQKGKMPAGVYKTNWETTDHNIKTAFCDSANPITNCSKYSNNLYLNLTFDQRFYLGCVECDTNYSLVYSFYNVTIEYQQNTNLTYNEYKFKWVMNECVLSTSIPTTEGRVNNCFSYQRYLYSGEELYECKNCSPKYYPSYKTLPNRCNSSDPYYEATTISRCKANYKCNDYLYCEPICSPACTSTQFCDNSGLPPFVCKDLKCIGCTADQYCEEGVCKPKCECNKLGNFNFECPTPGTSCWKCDASTNYLCRPNLCNNAITINIEDRLENFQTFQDTNTQLTTAGNYIRKNLDFSVHEIILPFNANGLAANVKTTFSDDYKYEYYVNGTIIKRLRNVDNSLTNLVSATKNITTYPTNSTTKTEEIISGSKRTTYDHLNGKIEIYFANGDYNITDVPNNLVITKTNNLVTTNYNQGTTATTDDVISVLDLNTSIITKTYPNPLKVEITYPDGRVTTTENGISTTIYPANTSEPYKSIIDNTITKIKQYIYKNNWIKNMNTVTNKGNITGFDPLEITSITVNVDEFDSFGDIRTIIYADGRKKSEHEVNLWYKEYSTISTEDYVYVQTNPDSATTPFVKYVKLWKDGRITRTYNNNVIEIEQNGIIQSTVSGDFYIQQGTEKVIYYADGNVKVINLVDNTYTLYKKDGTKEITNSSGETIQEDIFDKATKNKATDFVSFNDPVGITTNIVNGKKILTNTLNSTYTEGAFMTSYLDDKTIYYYQDQDNIYKIKKTNGEIKTKSLSHPFETKVVKANKDWSSIDYNYLQKTYTESTKTLVVLNPKTKIKTTTIFNPTTGDSIKIENLIPLITYGPFIKDKNEVVAGTNKKITYRNKNIKEIPDTANMNNYKVTFKNLTTWEYVADVKTIISGAETVTINLTTGDWSNGATTKTCTPVVAGTQTTYEYDTFKLIKETDPLNSYEMIITKDTENREKIVKINDDILVIEQYLGKETIHYLNETKIEEPIVKVITITRTGETETKDIQTKETITTIGSITKEVKKDKSISITDAGVTTTTYIDGRVSIDDGTTVITKYPHYIQNYPFIKTVTESATTIDTVYDDTSIITSESYDKTTKDLTITYADTSEKVIKGDGSGTFLTKNTNTYKIENGIEILSATPKFTFYNPISGITVIKDTTTLLTEIKDLDGMSFKYHSTTYYPITTTYPDLRVKTETALGVYTTNFPNTKNKIEKTATSLKLTLSDLRTLEYSLEVITLTSGATITKYYSNGRREVGAVKTMARKIERTDGTMIYIFADEVLFHKIDNTFTFFNIATGTINVIFSNSIQANVDQDGRVEITDLGDGSSVVFEGLERKITRGTVLITDNYFTLTRTIVDGTKTTTIYKSGIIVENDSATSTKTTYFTDGSFSVENATTKIFTNVKFKYIITLEIATNIITKTYTYHPIIEKEETSGPDNNRERKIYYKTNYQWKSLTYKSDGTKERVDKDDKLWIISSDGLTETYTKDADETWEYNNTSNTLTKTNTSTSTTETTDKNGIITTTTTSSKIVKDLNGVLTTEPVPNPNNAKTITYLSGTIVEIPDSNTAKIRKVTYLSGLILDFKADMFELTNGGVLTTYASNGDITNAGTTISKTSETVDNGITRRIYDDRKINIYPNGDFEEINILNGTTVIYKANTDIINIDKNGLATIIKNNGDTITGNDYYTRVITDPTGIIITDDIVTETVNINDNSVITNEYYDGSTIQVSGTTTTYNYKDKRRVDESSDKTITTFPDGTVKTIDKLTGQQKLQYAVKNDGIKERIFNKYSEKITFVDETIINKNIDGKGIITSQGVDTTITFDQFEIKNSGTQILTKNIFTGLTEKDDSGVKTTIDLEGNELKDDGGGDSTKTFLDGTTLKIVGTLRTFTFVNGNILKVESGATPYKEITIGTNIYKHETDLVTLTEGTVNTVYDFVSGERKINTDTPTTGTITPISYRTEGKKLTFTGETDYAIYSQNVIIIKRGSNTLLIYIRNYSTSIASIDFFQSRIKGSTLSGATLRSIFGYVEIEIPNKLEIKGVIHQDLIETRNLETFELKNYYKDLNKIEVIKKDHTKQIIYNSYPIVEYNYENEITIRRVGGEKYEKKLDNKETMTFADNNKIEIDNILNVESPIYESLPTKTNLSEGDILIIESNLKEKSMKKGSNIDKLSIYVAVNPINNYKLLEKDYIRYYFINNVIQTIYQGTTLSEDFDFNTGKTLITDIMKAQTLYKFFTNKYTSSRTSFPLETIECELLTYTSPDTKKYLHYVDGTSQIDNGTYITTIATNLNESYQNGNTFGTYNPSSGSKTESDGITWKQTCDQGWTQVKTFVGGVLDKGTFEGFGATEDFKKIDIEYKPGNANIEHLFEKYDFTFKYNTIINYSSTTTKFTKNGGGPKNQVCVDDAVNKYYYCSPNPTVDTDLSYFEHLLWYKPNTNFRFYVHFNPATTKTITGYYYQYYIPGDHYSQFEGNKLTGPRTQTYTYCNKNVLTRKIAGITGNIWGGWDNVNRWLFPNGTTFDDNTTNPTEPKIFTTGTFIETFFSNGTQKIQNGTSNLTTIAGDKTTEVITDSGITTTTVYPEYWIDQNILKSITIFPVSTITSTTFFRNSTFKYVYPNETTKYDYNNGTIFYQHTAGNEWYYFNNDQKYIYSNGDNYFIDDSLKTKTFTYSNTNVFVTYLTSNTVVKYYKSGATNGDIETINADGSSVYNYLNGDKKVTDQFGGWVFTYFNQDPIKDRSYIFGPSVNPSDSGWTITNYLNGNVFREKGTITHKIWFNHETDIKEVIDSSLKSTSYYKKNGDVFTEILNTDNTMKNTIYTNQTVSITEYFNNLADVNNKHKIYYDFVNGTNILFDKLTHSRMTTFDSNNTSIYTYINGTNVVYNPPPETGDIAIELINANQFIYRTYKNGTVVQIDPEKFIYSGCWRTDDECVLHKCYPANQKCNCQQNQVCVLSGGKNVCNSNASCSVCQSQNKWCKSMGSYVLCIDKPQETANENDTSCSPACRSHEICANGQCIYKGTPCFWDLPDGTYGKVGVFCYDDETCINGACVKVCKRKCEKKETCFPLTSVTTQSFGSCELKPTVPVVNVIDTCTLIQNCDETLELNICKKCLNGYSFERKVTNGVVSVDTKNCILSTPNCMYARTNPATGDIECDPFVDTLDANDSGCYTGYRLSNGLCVDITEACLNYDSNGNCRWCSEGYSNEGKYAISGRFDKGECRDFPVNNYSLVGTQTMNPSYDVNCSYFYYKVNLPVGSVNKLSNGKNECMECKDGYFLNSAKQCLTKSISLCGVYKLISTPTNIQCESCELGARWNTSMTGCLDNTPTTEDKLIPKCLKYDFPARNCLKCDTNYVTKSVQLLNSEGQSVFCFKLVNPPYCTSTDSSYFTTSGKIKCTRCDPIQNKPTYPKNIDIQKDICVDVAPQRNCVSHKVDLYSNSNLDCLECNPSSYLGLFQGSTTKYVCLPRIYPDIPNCIKYAFNQDKCETFLSDSTSSNTVVAETTVISADIEVLLANPPPPLEKDIIIDFAGWIMGCDVYQDEQSCERCFAPKHINKFGFEYNTKCISVEKVISNCKYYSTDGLKCEVCQDYYLLINDECRLKRVVNCLGYENEKKCKLCPITYPFRDEDGNCSKHPLNPWCLEYNYDPQAKKTIELNTFIECNICEEDFYPDDSGFCRLLEKKIDNCKYYLADSLCKVCEEGTYLKYNGKECITNPSFDENCEDFNYNTECSICNYKHYLKDGKCVKCEANLEEGCAFCNPQKPSECLICKPGYSFSKIGCKETIQGKSSKVQYFDHFNYDLEDATKNAINVQKTTLLVNIVEIVFLFALFLFE